jgi:ABC-type lipoprotein export system ATPase subunit
MGDVISIVGPTGSGKTTLINDLELFADANTQTGRRMLIKVNALRWNIATLIFACLPVLYYFR